MLQNKEKNFISAVVYVHNDEASIEGFLTQLRDVLFENFEKFEIICVNDASTDQSADVMRKVARTCENCVFTILKMSYCQGLELCMNAGVDLAIGDFVLEFDHNFVDYEKQTILDVYYRALQGFDIVAASNQRQRLASRMFYGLFNKNAGTQYKVGSETFRILSRRAINRVRSMSKTIPYRKALYANCGLKADTLRYEAILKSAGGGSRERFSARRDTAFNSLILFTDVAYKFSVFMTAAMMLATLGVAVYTLVVFATGQPVEGFTTTMLVLTGSFFGVFLILAIIIKYLSVLVDLVFKRQKYMIEEIEKITTQ